MPSARLEPTPTPPDDGRTPGLPAGLPWIALVFCASLAAYLPAIRGGFIWNDSDYVTQPQLRSIAGLWRIWAQVGATQQYYPALHSAFWIEHRLWGDAPLGYHLANVLLHATAACLLAAVLRRLAVPGAGLAGLVFALHPVCVESVAWISEQKNTLSAVFYLLAALAYLEFDKRREERRGQVPEIDATRRINFRDPTPLYLLATVLFVLALLSKSVTATLPAALLVVFWWRRGRLSWRRDAVPLVPWFALGAADGLFTAWVEHTYIGAKGGDFSLNIAGRCLVAGRAFWFYLAKLLWPVDLVFVYPRWTVDTGAAWQYLFPLAAIGLFAALWAIRGRARAPLAAMLFFAGSLFPTLGFLNVFAFIFSYVADHFQYLACMGVIALGAAACHRWQRGQASDTDAPRRQRGQVSEIDVPRHINFRDLTPYFVVCLLGILTWRQSRMYRDVVVFYRTTIERNPAAWMAHHNLGATLAEAGLLPEAAAEYQASLRIKPDNALAEYNLGTALYGMGRTQEALEHFGQALLLQPEYVKAHYAMGNALARSGHLAEAAEHYRAALRFDPSYAAAHRDLGNALIGLGRLEEAIGQLQQALAIEPGDSRARDSLGGALIQTGRLEEAIGQFQGALAANPKDAEAHYDLGIALAQTNRLGDAIIQFQEAVALKPDDGDSRVNLALAFAAAGRIPEAVAQCEAALRLNPGFGPARELRARLAGASMAPALP